MKTYKVDLVSGNLNMLRLSVLKQDDGDANWDYVGVGIHDRIARCLLLGITNNVTLTFAMVERFEQHFLNGKKCFPRLIREQDVFKWLGEQVGAML